MGYLNTYGTRKFQEGGQMAPAPEAPAGPPAEGGEGEEQLIALAEAVVNGDQEAAMQLGVALAPMILEQAAAMGGGGGAPMEEAAPVPGGTPQFKRGGTFVGKR